MKIIVKRTKPSQIFEEGREYEMDFKVSGGMGTTVLEIAIEGWNDYVGYDNDVATSSIYKFFTSAQDIIEGWQFVKIVEGEL